MLDVGLSRYFSGELPHGSAYYVCILAYNNVGSSDYSNLEYFVLDGSTPLQVSPTSLTLETGETGTCAISGGTGYYDAFSSDSSVAEVTVSGSTLNVLGGAAGSATITVYDSAMTVKTVSVTSTGPPATYSNSLGQSFVLIPSGTFTMGSPTSEPGRNKDEAQHEVVITQPYYMQATEVTQAQWKAVMGRNPSHFSSCGDNCPAENISWNDAQDYIVQMNALGEGTYRLPTEAEWEYASRAGSTTAFGNGEITQTGCSNDPILQSMGWYCYNASNKTHPVAQKTPNAWGLYDMHGNAWEWCHDWYDSYPSQKVTDPTGPSTGSGRLVRGGSWFDNAMVCRSAYRYYSSPTPGDSVNGLRLVKEPLLNMPLGVIPTSLSVSAEEITTCSISGGTKPYVANSSNMAVATVSVTDGTLYVTGVSAGSATLIVNDSASAATSVGVSVTGSGLVTITPDLYKGPDPSLWSTQGDLSFGNGVMTIMRGEIYSSATSEEHYLAGLYFNASTTRSVVEISADIMLPSISEHGNSNLDGSYIGVVLIRSNTKEGVETGTSITLSRYYPSGETSICMGVYDFDTLIDKYIYGEMDLDRFYSLKVKIDGSVARMFVDGVEIHTWNYDSQFEYAETRAYIHGWNFFGQIEGKAKNIYVRVKE